MLGSASQSPREVVWYLAKFTRDLARDEPVNVGLVVRRAETDDLAYRFLPELPPPARSVDVENYAKQTADWKGQMDRYQSRCLLWLPKRQPFPPFRFVLAGRKVVGGRIDLDGMFRQLVEPGGAQASTGPREQAIIADYGKLLDFLDDRFPDQVSEGESPVELAIRLILGQRGSRLPLPESD